MNRLIQLLSSLILIFGLSAIAHAEVGACVPDINQWGNSSYCECSTGSFYNPIFGTCGADPKSPGPACTPDLIGGAIQAAVIAPLVFNMMVKHSSVILIRNKAKNTTMIQIFLSLFLNIQTSGRNSHVSQ